MTDCVTAADGTSLLVTFASRGQAEAARAGAASLGSLQLSVSWAPPPSVAPAAVPQLENDSQVSARRAEERVVGGGGEQGLSAPLSRAYGMFFLHISLIYDAENTSVFSACECVIATKCTKHEARTLNNRAHIVL